MKQYQHLQVNSSMKNLQRVMNRPPLSPTKGSNKDLEIIRYRPRSHDSLTQDDIKEDLEPHKIISIEEDASLAPGKKEIYVNQFKLKKEAIPFPRGNSTIILNNEENILGMQNTVTSLHLSQGNKTL